MLNYYAEKQEIQFLQALMFAEWVGTGVLDHRKEEYKHLRMKYPGTTNVQ